MSYKNFSNTYKDILTAEARKISPKERQLAMKGLGGENVQQIMRALQDPEKAVKNPQLRDIIMKVMQQLLDIVVDDPVTFMKTRKALTKEDVDPTDTGGKEEVSMAMNQINQARHYLDGIEKMVKKQGDMEEWVQNKMTKATDYLKSVYGYNTGKDVKEEGYSAEINEVDTDTLKSYHKRSQDHMTTALKSNDPKMKKKLGNRLTGSGRAYQKLKARGVSLNNSTDKDVKESKVLNLENVVHIRKTTPKMEYAMIKSALKKHKGKYAESWDKHHVFEFKNPEIVDSFINELKSKYVEIPPNKEKK